MKNVLNKLGVFARKAKLQKGTLYILGAFFVLQLYFVRELLAAEFLFVLGFAALLLLGAVVYFVGAMSMRGLDLAESGVRVIADSARRAYDTLEEISRKPFRHPRSESAQ
jgi:hypothetical protein